MPLVHRPFGLSDTPSADPHQSPLARLVGLTTLAASGFTVTFSRLVGSWVMAGMFSATLWSSALRRTAMTGPFCAARAIVCDSWSVTAMVTSCSSFDRDALGSWFGIV